MYRKGVSALIINSKNEFLIVNLDSFEERYFAIPGGGLDEGETLEDAAYREIQEELSIPKESLEFIGKGKEPLLIHFKTISLHRDGKEYKGSERFFLGFRYKGNESDIVPAPGEVRKYKWVSLKDLKEYLLFDNQLENTVEKIKEIFPEIIKNLD